MLEEIKWQLLIGSHTCAMVQGVHGGSWHVVIDSYDLGRKLGVL